MKRDPTKLCTGGVQSMEIMCLLGHYSTEQRLRLLVGFSTPPAPAADLAAAIAIAWLSRERLSSALIIGALSIIARFSLTDARRRRGARFVFIGEGERALLLTGLSGWLLSCSRAEAVPRLNVGFSRTRL